MASEVELQGIDGMLTVIRNKIASGIYQLENEGLRASGEIIAEAQREKVAVSTINHEHIQADIKVSGVRRGDGLRFVLIGTSKKTSWRLHFLEYGTKRMPPQPFIIPSFQENKDRIASVLANAQRKGMMEA
ncbi:hypothetical protein P4H66_23435 [Paenibacillus dokdonensis]|uniref:HK97 gp10 family phage protein n=1 Tax=Paenibacillus dokdonensis TaxID=2567944 RepID=A0ABU6GU63_9BACL|nr:HK97-gp10 family putative phage morphogenesis protein [Paenibacillus dokdonensis]MEC0242768.1 hypothetical protein [Paenibacillus dokdonensis]